MAKNKIVFKKRRPDDEKAPPGPAGPQGPPGPKGAQGEPGRDGKDGDDGRSAYEVWLAEGNKGTEEEFLKSLKGKTGAKGARGARGPQGAGGQGPRGPRGLPGEAPAPASSVITRDANGRPQTVAVEGRPTVTITRNPDGSAASIVSSERTVTIDRDVEDRVSGTTVTDAGT